MGEKVPPQRKETSLQGRRFKKPAKIFNDQLDTSGCAFILTGLKDARVRCESGVRPTAPCFRKVDLLSAAPLWSRVAVFYYSAAQIARKQAK